MQEFIDKWLYDPTVTKAIATAFVIILVMLAVRTGQRVLGRNIQSAERRYHLRKLITFGRFYDVGDRVQLGGIKGDVIDIGVLRTTLMECGAWINGDQYNGRIVRVANSFIFKEPVYNYSSDFPFLWDEITIPVRYGSNYELARKGFQKILEDVTGEHARHLKGEWRKMTGKYMLEDARLEPMVTVSMTGNWAEYALRYVLDYKKRRSTKDAISMRILSLIDQSEGEIKLGTSSFDLAAVPPLDITLHPQR